MTLSSKVPIVFLRKETVFKIEYVFAVLGVLFYSEALGGILSSIGMQQGIKIIRYSILFGSLFSLLLNFKATQLTLQRGKWIWPITCLAMSSFLWSKLPGVTIQSVRSELIPLTIFGIYLASRFNRKQLFEVIYTSSLIAFLFSVFYSTFLPSIGRHPIDHPYPGAWKGVFDHKNGFGVNLMVVSTMTALKALYPRNKLGKQKSIVLLAFIYVLVFLSKSTAALLISLFVVALIFLYKQFKWRGKSTVLLLTALIIVVGSIITAVILSWTPLMLALGKDPTMSARTLIWDFVLNYRVFPESPLLGFGRGTFWQTPRLFGGIWHAAHHTPAHAHNGYVDLLADLGLVGLVLFIISAVFMLIRALRLAYRTKLAEDVWPLNFMIIFLVGNVIESLLMRGESFTWLLYIALFCSSMKKGKAIESVH